MRWTRIAMGLLRVTGPTDWRINCMRARITCSSFLRMGLRHCVIVVDIWENFFNSDRRGASTFLYDSSCLSVLRTASLIREVVSLSQVIELDAGFLLSVDRRQRFCWLMNELDSWRLFNRDINWFLLYHECLLSDRWRSPGHWSGNIVHIIVIWVLSIDLVRLRVLQQVLHFVTKTC